MTRLRQIENCQLSTINCQLRFRQPAGTSRGTYTIRNVWYVIISSKESPSRCGIGECAPLPDLSIDATQDYEKALKRICRQYEKEQSLNIEELRSYPSILFGLETAIRHFETGSFNLWNTAFSRGETGIPINGLIWMGSFSQMQEQIEQKLAAGFRCIKLKIGSIRFKEELELLKRIRREYSSNLIEIRVDANGAFTPGEAMEKLNRLAELDLHSIEQPIKVGQWEEMAKLTSNSPLPIALDEELIGNYTHEEKRKLLEDIRPQYIILKPTLHGGLDGCKEWIEESKQFHINWWITSALESNIGLNAIAQWTATWNNPLPQGLGTGQLYVENVEMPLSIRRDNIWFDPEKKPETFFGEWFSASPFITSQTSGSTGRPKSIHIRKQHMIESARTTTSFLNLHPGDKALLCMPEKYIAGKMMFIRTLIAGLDLIIQSPSTHPLAAIKEPLDFVAMTPMQVYNSLQIPEEKKRLKEIRNLLIGGSPITKDLEKAVYSFPHAVYSTYGMTETVSHIALRRLNGPETSEYYIPFPSVKLSLSPDNTLIINAPLIADSILITNDIAELHPDGRFRILGRKDNIINSGGIKIQIEQLENILRTIISSNFAVTSVNNPELGEVVVLLIEKQNESLCIDTIKDQINLIVPKYHCPKYVFATGKIPLTGSDKTDRSACKELATKLFQRYI